MLPSLDHLAVLDADVFERDAYTFHDAYILAKLPLPILCEQWIGDVFGIVW